MLFPRTVWKPYSISHDYSIELLIVFVIIKASGEGKEMEMETGREEEMERVMVREGDRDVG